MYKKIKDLLRKNETLFAFFKYLKNHSYDYYKEMIRNRRFIKNGKQVLCDFDDAMQAANIRYWLCFGTLLGAVREKGFIGHDLDIDLGIYKSNYSEKMEKSLQKFGFRKTKEFLIDEGEYGREQTYMKNNVSIDVFFYQTRGDKTFCHLFDSKDECGNLIDVDVNGYVVRELSYPSFELKKIELFGREFFIPKNHHDVLMSDYGSNYMVPDPNYRPGKRNNVNYINNKVGVFQSY